MIYLLLFWEFFKIGLFTFGGGYAMIPLIQDTVVGMGWLTETELLNFIGISEATPGPFAVNIATFVGYGQAGILGGITATLGVVAPSFFIIIAVFKLISLFGKSKTVDAAFSGIIPIICGLILATGLTLLLKQLVFSISSGILVLSVDWRAIAIAVIVIAVMLSAKAFSKKGMSAYAVIIISALLGIAIYSI